MASKQKKVKRKRLKSKTQVNKMKSWSFVLIFAGFLLFGVASYLYTILNNTQTIEQGGGVLAIPIAEHNFGAVSVKDGVVSTEVPLVNIGEEDLIIHYLTSSCGCTTARVENNGKVGPSFGMASSGRSPNNWQTTIKPGKQASLKIYYDPSVHPKFRGAATRIVTIMSNEKVEKQKTVRIKVNQID